MEENTRIELERANLTNYILQKENKILFETIESLARQKEQLQTDLENSKKNVFYRIAKKIMKIPTCLIKRYTKYAIINL